MTMNKTSHTNTRKHFPVYLTWGKNIKKMSTAEKALLLDKLFQFYEYEDESSIPDEMVRLESFWDNIYDSVLIPNEEKYQQASGNRRDALMKNRLKNPKVNQDLPIRNTETYPLEIPISNHLVSNVNVNDNVNDNDNDNDNVNDNENVNDKINEIVTDNDLLMLYLEDDEKKIVQKHINNPGNPVMKGEGKVLTKFHHLPLNISQGTSEPIEPYTSELIQELKDKGKTYESLILLYPEHRGEIIDLYMDSWG